MLEARTRGHGRAGVFWQTQGSGKSFSMVFFAQKVLRKLPGNWTFVVVTDRVELDDQIAKTFKATGAVSAPEGDECHASSGAHLRELLRGNHRYIFSLLQKFQPEREATRKPSPPAPLLGGEEGTHFRAGYSFAGLTKRAREMRDAGTTAEGILWEMLRNRQLCGLKFRRQHQIGDYIVDFFCAEARLVVELDGGVHDRPDVTAKDAKREKWLVAQGFHVLRFRNEQVTATTEEVLSTIAAVSQPSTSGRGRTGEGQPSLMPLLSDREDIIVMVDEAHRSQYDTLALNMRAALPKALFLAFTGTPLMVGEERTKEVFGDYVSIYDFQQSVEDGATVPLYYENRTPELKLVNPDLNEDIYALIEEAELNDEAERRLERELGRQYHILTRDDRLETVAKDLVQHFLGRGFPGKAMVVSIDKATALKMHDKVRAHWQAERKRVEREVTALSRYDTQPDDERKQALLARLDLLKTTDMALIVSPGQNEIEQMKKQGLDILPHRMRINESQPPLDEKFKDADDPLRIVFLCAMWLTGFDAPSCSTVYLDKPMRNHTLMQTIARANRVFPGKHSGMIVDYCNVFASLEKALAIYAQGRGGAMPVRDKLMLVAELRGAMDAAVALCAQKGVDIGAICTAKGMDKLAAFESAINRLISPDQVRKEFLAHERLVRTLYDAVKPDPAAIEYTGRAACLGVIAAAIRERTGEGTADISGVMKDINRLLDSSIAANGFAIRDAPRDGHAGILDLSRIDFAALAARFARSKTKNIQLEQLKAAIRAQLDRMITVNKTRIDFRARFEELVESYNAGSRSIEELFDELLNFSRSLNEETQRHVRENLTEDELVIFDILTRPAPDLSTDERKEVKKVASQLLKRIKSVLVLDWRRRADARARVRLAIEDTLDTGLPRVYSPDIYKRKCVLVFDHIYETYGSEDATTRVSAA